MEAQGAEDRIRERAQDRTQQLRGTTDPSTGGASRA